jgi:DNA-binding CsgD family transcriptional regulator
MSTNSAEGLALRLTGASRRIRERGQARRAAELLLRAARLSASPALRADRLVEAACVHVAETGRIAEARRLLAEAECASADALLRRAVVVAHLAVEDGQDVGVAAARLGAVLDRLPGLSAAAAEEGRRALRQLGGRYREDITGPPTDPRRVNEIGEAALAADRLDECRAALRRAATAAMAGGANVEAAESFFLLAVDDINAGRWDVAAGRSVIGRRLVEARGVTRWRIRFDYLDALLAALRGEACTAGPRVSAAIVAASHSGVRADQHRARHAAAILALGLADFDAAYDHACAVTPPGELPADEPSALWTASLLVEAAMRTGRRTVAEQHATAFREVAETAASPRLTLQVLSSLAMVTEQRQYFRDALATPGADRWPFDQARVALLYGEALRRGREISRSRRYLELAVTSFERLGAAAWTDRARTELAATAPQRRAGSALTAQERTIAEYAAAGLTNGQIADRLRISPRTVAGRLRSAYAKLNVSSRAALRDVLGPMVA